MCQLYSKLCHIIKSENTSEYKNNSCETSSKLWFDESCHHVETVAVVVDGEDGPAGVVLDLEVAELVQSNNAHPD